MRKSKFINQLKPGQEIRITMSGARLYGNRSIYIGKFQELDYRYWKRSERHIYGATPQTREYEPKALILKAGWTRVDTATGAVLETTGRNPRALSIPYIKKIVYNHAMRYME